MQVPVTGSWGETYTYPQVPTPHIDPMRRGGGYIEGKITSKVRARVWAILGAGVCLILFFLRRSLRW